MRCAYISHADCALHVMGEAHPESPARIGAVEAGLRHAGVLERMHRVDAPLVTRGQLLRVHEARYLDALELAQPREGIQRLDPDTALGPGSLEAARRAAGAVVRAVDMVMAGEAPSAFCAVRPGPEHQIVCNPSTWAR